MGHGIPDLERTTEGKVLWRTIEYLPSWLKDTSLIFQTSRVIKGRESIMALFGINRPTRSSWVRAREVGYQYFQVVEWRSDTRSYREDFNNSQWEFMSHSETGSQELIRNLCGLRV